jgi:hypothetical protein
VVTHNYTTPEPDNVDQPVGKGRKRKIRSALHFRLDPYADSAGTLPKPCNAGFIGIEWIMEDFTESEVQQRWRSAVLDLQEVPLQAFLSVLAEPVSAICLQR